MDYQELSYRVAKRFGGVPSDEVEAELKHTEIEAKFGSSKGVIEILTVAALIVQLARVAAKFWATTEELITELNTRAASAKKIDEKTREKILNFFVEEIDV
jgi:hypothetical protein